MNTTTEIRVMTSGAFTAAYLELVPRLEALTKKKLVTAATSIGTGENSIPNRLRRGEAVDVVIVADAVLVGFIKDGLIMADSYTPLARSAIGMAVRAGASKPDIGTVDALKRTLLQAKSIAYSASVSGDYLTKELFQRLGIADQVMSKSRLVVGAFDAHCDALTGLEQSRRAN
jgi:molybdate transport system substrate-binding protein